MSAKVSAVKIRRLIACVVFVFLAWEIFVHLTYIFRNTSWDRLNLVSFSDVEEDSLDVVMIGASSTFRYWDPMQAWKDCGMASYNYSVSSMPAPTAIAAIRDVYKTQRPAVVVIETRKFLTSFWDTDITGGGYRNVMDSYDFTPQRLCDIAYFQSLHSEEAAQEDTLSAYLDIMYYHANTQSLANSSHWGMLGNNTAIVGPSSEMLRGVFNGFYAAERTAGATLFPGYAPPDTQEQSPLPAASERSFRDVLEYCRENDVPLLLAESPFIMTERDAAESNTLERIAGEYGVTYLNMNRNWEDMALDPTTDFYDARHVNALGVEKYTAFFASWLGEHYDIADHRADASYGGWDAQYDEVYAPHMERLREKTGAIAEEKLQALADEAQMRGTTDAVEWLALADNANMTVLASAHTDSERQLPSGRALMLVKQFGLMPYFASGSRCLAAAYAGQQLSADTSGEEYSGEITVDRTVVPYAVSAKDRACITVGGKEICADLRPGLHIVVLDNSTAQIADFVILDITEQGELELAHMPIPAD